MHLSEAQPTTLAKWKRSGTYFIYKNRRVFFQRSGQGKKEAVVFIHGFPTSSWDFHRIWNPLTKDHQMIAPDLLGFGYSDKPKNYSYSIHDQADLIVGLVKSQGLTSVKLVAHDYGATVAQELLARAHKGNLAFRLEKVVLMNGGLFPEMHRPTSAQKLLLSPFGSFLVRFMGIKQLRRSFGKIFGRETQPTKREIDDFWSLIAHHDGNKIVHKLLHYVGDRKAHRERWVEALKTPGIPLMFINGQADPVSGSHMADKFQEEVPKPNIVRLDDIGHYPQLEAPERVLEAIIGFF